MRTLSLILALSLMVIACKKDKDEEPPITINKTVVTVNHGTTDQLTLSRIISCTWDSDDDYIASVSSSGLVTGNIIGQTKVHARLTSGQTFECTVNVEPLTMMYEEPVFLWGNNKTSVKYQENRDLIEEDGEFLVYAGENNKVDLVMYMFADNQLESVIVLLKDPDANYDEAQAFMDERYEFVEELNDVPDTEFLLVYQNRDNVMAGLSIHATLGLNVLYMENSQYKSVLTDRASKYLERFRGKRKLI